MKEVLLSAKGIKKTFHAPQPISPLRGVDIEVRRGETLAIVGKSGEGKSTLLHILGTLEPPCEGSLTICGKDTATTSLPELRGTHLGFIFQSFYLLEEYTLLENVLMPAKIARKPISPSSSAYQRALFLLGEVGLKERAHSLAKLLSGGEKQRLALARALCNDPDILLADEPSGNLDSEHSKLLHQLLLSCATSLNKALIVVTHDLELAACCQKTFTLKDGVLL